jgi:tryptophan synthase alpha chain
VTEFRKADRATPIVLMGYANPIEAMGVEKFVAAAKKADIDGVIVVDYPPEECEQFAALAKKHDIDPVFLLAPTSTDKRIEQVGRVGSGYLYYVSLRGVTGASHIDPATSRRAFPRSGRLPICRSGSGSAFATRNRPARWRRPPMQSSSVAVSFRRSRRAPPSRRRPA